MQEVQLQKRKVLGKVVHNDMPRMKRKHIRKRRGKKKPKKKKLVLAKNEFESDEEQKPELGSPVGSPKRDLGSMPIKLGDVRQLSEREGSNRYASDEDAPLGRQPSLENPPKRQTSRPASPAPRPNTVTLSDMKRKYLTKLEQRSETGSIMSGGQVDQSEIRKSILKAQEKDLVQQSEKVVQDIEKALENAKVCLEENSIDPPEITPQAVGVKAEEEEPFGPPVHLHDDDQLEQAEEPQPRETLHDELMELYEDHDGLFEQDLDAGKIEYSGSDIPSDLFTPKEKEEKEVSQ